MTIILTGFMGAGKTSVAKQMSQALGIPFLDLDDLIEEKTKLAIKDIFAQYGEEKFREIEHEVLREQLHFPGIISTGGGCVETVANQALLQDSKQVVYLETSWETVCQRLLRDHMNKRPLVDQRSLQKLQKRFNKRRPLYEKYSNYQVTTDNRSPEQIMAQILQLPGLKLP